MFRLTGTTLCFTTMLLVYTGDAYKILAVFPMPSLSHYGFSSKLINELAVRGHHVTYITPFPNKDVLENVTEISVSSVIEATSGVKKNLFTLESSGLIRHVRMMLEIGYVLTKSTLQDDNVQELLHSNEKFDLVLVHQLFNEGLLGIAHHFNAPVVLLSPMPLFSWSSFLLSDPTSSSYVPNMLLEYTGQMNFWQRFINTMADVFCIVYHQWIALPQQRELVKRFIPNEPDLYLFMNNISLLLVNSHPSILEPKPVTPNTIEIGGLHIKEPKPLPDDLQQFLDNAKDGVVVFSMGSNLNSSDLPKEKRVAILKTFEKLKQKVLWKWETDELPGQPPNVKIIKWLPQSSVLAHPNTRAFITHGGIFTLMECVYFQVPIIGIPIFADQKINIQRAVAYEYGVTVPLNTLSDDSLSSALRQILEDPKYKNNVKDRSCIMRNQQIKPLDNAVHWIEYVIKHAGAYHLRYPGTELFWFQRHLIDVWVFTATTLVFIIYMLVKSIQKVRPYLCSQKNKRKKKD